MQLIKGNVLVEWEDIGEGWQGEYDDTNPDDQALLRFYVAVRDAAGSDIWTEVEDASYCTAMPVDTCDHVLAGGLGIVMEVVYDRLARGESIKKVCEALSWLDVNTVAEWGTGRGRSQTELLLNERA